MHSQIVRDAPGACPICGMALEPMTPSADRDPNPELADMTRRFWIGLGDVRRRCSCWKWAGTF